MKKMKSHNLLLILIIVIGFSGCENKEQSGFIKAKQENTVESIKSFLNKWPSGKHSAEARHFLEDFEKRDFELAKQQGTAQAFQDFLAKWPNGKMNQETKELFGDALYKEAEEKGEIAIYRQYLDKFPDRKYAKEAQEKVDEALCKEVVQKCIASELETAFKKCKTAKYADEIWRVWDETLYKEAVERQDIAKFRQYMAQFPNGGHFKEVKDRVFEIEYQQALNKDTVEAWDEFLKHNDTRLGEELYKRALEKLKDVRYRAAVALQSLGDIEEFLEKYQWDQDERIKEIKNLQEEILYKSIKEKPSIELCEKYLRLLNLEEPRLSQVRAIMEPLLFDWAVKTNTIDSYEKYLTKYPKGFHSEEIGNFLDGGLFEKSRIDNSLESYDAYLKRYPNGKHVSEVKTAMEPLMFENASKNDWYTDYEAYLEKYPNGKFAEKAKERISWLKSQRAIMEVEYSAELESTSSPYYNVASPYWEWNIVFKEKGGKIGYRVTGVDGYALDPEGNKWGVSSWAGGYGVPFTRGEVKVPAGGVTKSPSDWISSGSHNICNGYHIMTWTGEDAGGHPVSTEVKIHIIHKNCPGPGKK